MRLKNILNVIKKPKDETKVVNTIALCLVDDSKSYIKTPFKQFLKIEKLDFSFESLKILDDYLERIRANIKEITKEAYVEMVLRCGAYCGEVVRRHLKSNFIWIGYNDAAKVDSFVRVKKKSLSISFILYCQGIGSIYPMMAVEGFINKERSGLYPFAISTIKLYSEKKSEVDWVYYKLTKNILSKLHDDEIDVAIHHYVCSKIFANHKRSIKDKFKTLSKMKKNFQYIFSIRVFEDEVNNGGFFQFFYNTMGYLVFIVLEAFNEIGAKKHAKILTQVIENFNKIKPMKDAVRFAIENNSRIDEFYAEDFHKVKIDNELENEFYSLEKELNELRVKYIRKNIDKFIGN